MREDRISLTLKTLNEVLAYLGRRPYDEVAILVAAVHREAVAVKEAEDADEG